jgi:multiple sugar transport system substrate-binding protein
MSWHLTDLLGRTRVMPSKIEAEKMSHIRPTIMDIGCPRLARQGDLPKASKSVSRPVAQAQLEGRAGDAAVGPRVTRRALVGVTTTLSGTVTACARRSSGADQPPAKLSGPAAITAWLDPTGTFVPFFDGQIDLFRKANPSIAVTVEPLGDGNKLQANVVGGTPPDLIRGNLTSMWTFVKQPGVLEPLDGYLDKRGKSDFYDWPRDGSTYNGKMWQWPWMLNPTGIAVNRSIFREKNADNLVPQQGPKADWTFDQWKAALRAVSSVRGDAERDVYGTGWAAKDAGGDYYMLMYLWGNGAELYDKDQTKCTINTPEGYAGLQMIADVVLRERLALPGPENSVLNDLRPIFYRKQLAILHAAPADIAMVQDRLKDGTIAPPFDAQFLPTPHAPNKKSISYVAVNTFLVFKQKDMNRTTAAMRLAFHLTDVPAAKAIVPIGQLPARRSAGNIYPDDPNRTVALGMLDNSRDQGRSIAVTEIRTLFNNAARAVLTGQQTAQVALDEFARLGNIALAKANA